jgi:hypothetical protein
MRTQPAVCEAFRAAPGRPARQPTCGDQVAQTVLQRLSAGTTNFCSTPTPRWRTPRVTSATSSASDRYCTWLSACGACAGGRAGGGEAEGRCAVGCGCLLSRPDGAGQCRAAHLLHLRVGVEGGQLLLLVGGHHGRVALQGRRAGAAASKACTQAAGGWAARRLPALVPSPGSC